MTARVCIAQIGAAHGVRGEVRLKAFTEDPLGVARYGALETEDGKRRFEIEAARPAKDMLVARLKGVDGSQRRRAADATCGSTCARERLPQPSGRRVLSRRSDRACGGDSERRGARHREGRAQFRRRRSPGNRARGRRRDAAAAVHRDHRAGGRRRGRQDRGRSAAGCEDEAEPCGARPSSRSFPEMFPGPLGVEPRRQGARRKACGRSRRSTSAITRPTSTAPSTTRRPAAGPAW